MNKENPDFPFAISSLSFNLVAIGFDDLNHPVERNTFNE